MECVRKPVGKAAGHDVHDQVQSVTVGRRPRVEVAYVRLRVRSRCRTIEMIGREKAASIDTTQNCDTNASCDTPREFSAPDHTVLPQRKLGAQQTAEAGGTAIE